MIIDPAQLLKSTMVLFAVIDIVGSIPVLMDVKRKSGDIHPGRASLVALSAWPSSLENWKSLSVVVTIFSISELSLASRMGRRLMSSSWFGRSSPACFSPARATLAEMQAFRIPTVSRFAAGGRSGSVLKGLAESWDMFKKSYKIDTLCFHVD